MPRGQRARPGPMPRLVQSRPRALLRASCRVLCSLPLGRGAPCPILLGLGTHLGEGDVGEGLHGQLAVLAGPARQLPLVDPSSRDGGDPHACKPSASQGLASQPCELPGADPRHQWGAAWSQSLPLLDRSAGGAAELPLGSVLGLAGDAQQTPSPCALWQDGPSHTVSAVCQEHPKGRAATQTPAEPTAAPEASGTFIKLPPTSPTGSRSVS